MAHDRIVLDLENVKLNTWSTAALSGIHGYQRGKLFQALQRIFLVLLAGMTVFLLLKTFTFSDNERSPKESSTATEYQKSFKGNETLAKYLEREVRVLCWIMTSPKNHKTRAVHVKNTWGRRCTKLLFVTTKEDDELDTLVVDVEEKYANLWGKTRRTFKHLYEKHLDEYDWFMKADDDTYVFMENLRYMLYSYTPETPIFFGFNFKLGSERKHAYMSGGSGYTLSREALRRFGSISLNAPSGCRLNEDTGAEDAEMGICLRTANVSAGDSRDAVFKQRYDIFNPDGVLISNMWPKDFWYQKLSFYHAHLSRDTLSDYAIAFHYILPEDMYLYEYLKYEFEVFGLDRPEESLPKKLRADEVVIPPSDNDWK